MKYRKFGSTAITVSEIGFGAWAIGGEAMVGSTAIGWGKADDKTSLAAIDKAIDEGITFFDTADVYGLGRSEELIGKAIGNRDGIVIATKVGNVARDGKFTVDYSKEHMIAACENSLRRLKRESIDYYQLHSARMEHLLRGECIEVMKDLQRAGKIRYWGLSLNTFEPQAEAAYLMSNDLGNGLQLVLNLVNRLAIPVIREAAVKGYGIIARMPLQFGLLTGKFDSSVTFPADDHRQKRVTPSIIKEAGNALQPVWQFVRKIRMLKNRTGAELYPFQPRSIDSNSWNQNAGTSRTKRTRDHCIE
jgi:aryl-alcohol dehydrogenase-like predicted oxidoreductase